MANFTHLHVHTQYSLLDGAASIDRLVNKAVENKMQALAITDHGNMFGAFRMYQKATKAGIMPIIGCEFYVVEDRHIQKFTQGNRDKRYHQLLLAKNQKGYENLSKLCSLGFTTGFYNKFPRIDMGILRKYSEGLIATSCCIGAIIPKTMVHKGEEEAEKVFKEFLEIFGKDFYLELQRHFIKDIDGTGWDQEQINQVLIKWSKKYDVPLIATNDSHYVDQDDFDSHDILLCVNTASFKETPIGQGRDFRFGFNNDQYFFKTQEEMSELFSDVPEAIENTGLVLDSITPPKLARDIILPNYVVPSEFESQIEYLTHMAMLGAKERYGEISIEIEERIKFELKIIAGTATSPDYSGYFLIVEDLITAARKLDVWVGPGRGSAAGSVVAYCLKITNVDPIKYGLLFERFLNPERVSMPDIDIDFDNKGREKVMDYVANKYGHAQIAQIVTYGTMAAKMSVRDVARVLQYPLDETDIIAKLIPDAYSLNELKVASESEMKDKINSPEDYEKAVKLKEMFGEKSKAGEVLRQALKLEGSVRNTGVHACGVIISPDDITNYIPVAKSRDSEYLLAQYDVKVIEKAGLLKMDFLGLKTLSILKDCVELIKEKRNIDVDIENIPLDNKKTFELYQSGGTIGTFQFESGGMRNYLKQLKPNKFEDLVALNALFRPGPMEFIPSFIKRKHGQEEISYNIDSMEEHLKETYGITVYQEQIMLLSQKLANFTGGQADKLRKAMGKKEKSILDDLRPKFMDGCVENGHKLEDAEKIWKDWEAFAKYGFNKSHSVCYADLAYKTTYLKANYPAEYMASVIENQGNDVSKIAVFMEECNRMKLKVLGPDVNESNLKFTVNAQGNLRFGLGKIKGASSIAVEEMIKERNKNGFFESIFDLCSRVVSRNLNKRTLEAFALAGAFDFDDRYHRAQYVSDTDAQGGVEIALKFGKQLAQKRDSNQMSMFGAEEDTAYQDPDFPNVEEFTHLNQLKKEKGLIGFFLSAHPMDINRGAVNLVKGNSTMLMDMEKNLGQELRLVGILSDVSHLTTKTQKPYMRFKLNDYEGEFTFMLFGKDYFNFEKTIKTDTFVYIRGKIQESWGDRIEFKVQQVMPIDDAMKKYIHALVINFDIVNLTEDRVDVLNGIIENYPGNYLLNIKLIDMNDDLQISLNSKQFKVDLSPGLLDELQEQNFNYSVDTNF